MRLVPCLVIFGMAAACIWTRGLGGLSSNHRGALNYEQTNGRALFMAYCSVCHGTAGEGDGFNAFNLNPRPRNLADRQAMSIFSDAQLTHVIANGGRKRGKSNLMPAWRHTLSQRHIRYLVAYVRMLPTADGSGCAR